MDVSVVIPTLNEQSNLRRLLTDLSRQDLLADTGRLTLEILVADAGSRDATCAVARQFGATVVPGGLPAFGRNRGAEAAVGRVLFTMDADVRLTDPRFIVRAYEEFTRRRLDCAAMDNRFFWQGTEPLLTKCLIVLVHEVANLYVRYGQRTADPRAQGPCMVFKRASFLAVRGFDERIYWGEDSEIVKRLVAAGYRFGVLNSVVVRVSPRKPLTQGVRAYTWNAIKLNAFRSRGREVYSRRLYERLTGRYEYFARRPDA